MSEFKYACPVCGQHIKCDSSQAGTVMDCPTCFQKITVPQAPTGGDQKFILTGSKVSDKPPTIHGLNSPTAAPAKNFPGVAVVLLILIFMGTAAAAIYWATIIHPRQTARQSGNSTTTTTGTTDGTPKPKPKPALVAPPANDTNWMLTLDTNDIPKTPVVGRIHGQDFIAERAMFQNGTLTLRTGAHAPVELSVAINFSGAEAEDMADKTINVTTNADKAAKVSFHWKNDDGKGQKADFESGYALRLEFGTLRKNHLPGKIYLCTPDDEKSYLVGGFNADVRKPRSKANNPPKQQ